MLANDQWREIFRYLSAKDLIELSRVSRRTNIFVVRMLSNNQTYNMRLETIYPKWYEELRKNNMYEINLVSLLCRTLDIIKVSDVKPIKPPKERIPAPGERRSSTPIIQMNPVLESIRITDYVKSLFSLYKSRNVDNMMKVFYFVRGLYDKIPIDQLEQCIIDDMLMINPLLLAKYFCYCVGYFNKITYSKLSIAFGKHPKYLRRFILAMKSINAYNYLLAMTVNIIKNIEYSKASGVSIEEIFTLAEDMRVSLYGGRAYNDLKEYYASKGMLDRLENIYVDNWSNDYSDGLNNEAGKFVHWGINQENEIIPNQLLLEEFLGRRLMIRAFGDMGIMEYMKAIGPKLWKDLLDYAKSEDVSILLKKYGHSFEVCDTVLEIGMTTHSFNKAVETSINSFHLKWLQRLLLDNRIFDFIIDPLSLANGVINWNSLHNPYLHMGPILKLLTTNAPIKGLSRAIKEGVIASIKNNNVGALKVIKPYIEKEWTKELQQTIARTTSKDIQKLLLD